MLTVEQFNKERIEDVGLIELTEETGSKEQIRRTVDQIMKGMELVATYSNQIVHDEEEYEADLLLELLEYQSVLQADLEMLLPELLD